MWHCREETTLVVYDRSDLLTSTATVTSARTVSGTFTASGTFTTGGGYSGANAYGAFGGSGQGTVVHSASGSFAYTEAVTLKSS